MKRKQLLEELDMLRAYAQRDIDNDGTNAVVPTSQFIYLIDLLIKYLK